MMKKLFLICFICSGVFSYSQDQIYKKDNTKIDAKILLVTPTEIKYFLTADKAADTISILKGDVTLILFENGKHEVINTQTIVPSSVIKKTYSLYKSVRLKEDSITKNNYKQLTSTKNLISLNVLDILNGSIGLIYVREFSSHKLHLYLPFSTGYSAPHLTQGFTTCFEPVYYPVQYPFEISDFKYHRKSYDIGLGLHFQTASKSSATYFIGPYIGTAQFTGTYTEITNSYSSNYYLNGIASYAEKKFILTRIYFMLDNGFLYRVNKNFNIMLLIGIGYHSNKFEGKDLTRAYNFNDFKLTYYIAHKFNISFGYRF